MPNAERDALRESFRDAMREAAKTAHLVEAWEAQSPNHRAEFESRAAFARMTKPKPGKRKGY
jgi:hypothetical protein